MAVTHNNTVTHNNLAKGLKRVAMAGGLAAAAFGSVLSTSSDADALTVDLDFVAEAAGNERGVADGTTINYGGLNVTFSATHTGGDAFAYFDDLSGGKPAGLGACKVLTGSNQCSPSSDDNITSGEAVKLVLGNTSDLSDFVFYDGSHNAVGANETLLLSINGGALTQYTFGTAAAGFSRVASIEFAHDSASSGSQFYVGSATATVVPLPAGLLLLVSGLLGLGFLGRHRSKVRTAAA